MSRAALRSSLGGAAWLLLLLVLLSGSPARAAGEGEGRSQAEVRRFAVVVGTNDAGEMARKPLRFADDDAARFYEMVAPVVTRAYLLTSFDSASQEVFRELIPRAQPPRRDRLLEVAETVRTSIREATRAGHRTELLFFYAGHGDVEGGQGYVNLADGRFTRRDLREAFLTGERADVVHVFVDACKAYFLVAGRGPGGTREPHAPGFAVPEVTEGVGYVLSTSSDAEAHEWAAISSGIFSHEVRSALLGGADLDQDGAVDYEELAAFVAVANEGLRYPRYRPDFYILPPAGDQRASILGYAGVAAVSALRVEAALQGRLAVTDERGLRYADVNKATGAPLSLALLSPRRYRVAYGNSSYSLVADGSPLALAMLEQQEQQVFPRGDGHRAFEQLFATPFGPRVLRGFRLGRRSPLQPLAPAPAVAPGRPGWLGPTLLVGAAAALGGGLVLHGLAGEELDEASTGPQIDRPSHQARGNVYTWGAGAAYVAATAALSAAAWHYFLAD